MPSLKAEKFYDVQCDICGFWRSTDFFHGMESDLSLLRKNAKKEGWISDAKGFNICPLCVEKRTLEFERMDKHE